MTLPSPTPEQLQVKLEARLNGPAGTPPFGVRPNFDNPPNRDVVLHTTTAVFLTFTSLAVLIRIYTRRVLIRSVGYDDCKRLCPCWFRTTLTLSQDASIIAWVDIPTARSVLR